MRARIGVACIVVTCAIAFVACGGDDDGDAERPSPSSSNDASAEAQSGGDGATPPSDSGAKSDASTIDGGPDQKGQATYYDADGTGSCGFPKSTDLNVAAMNGTQYSKSLCGKCVDVTGPLGSVVVRIVDLCPGCKNGDLDLSKSAFQKIAKLSAGRVAITWHYVACP